MPTKLVLAKGTASVDTLESGTEACLRLVSSPALATTTGGFFERVNEARAHSSAYDPTVRRQLWQLSLELSGCAEPRAPGRRRTAFAVEGSP